MSTIRPENLESIRRIAQETNRSFMTNMGSILQTQAALQSFLSSVRIPEALFRSLQATEVLRQLNWVSTAIPSQLLRDMVLPATLLARHQAQLQATAGVLAQAQASMRKLFDGFNRLYLQSFEPLIELARRVGEAKEVSSAFQSYGLWLAPSMPEELVSSVVQLEKQGAKSGTVHSVVSRRYTKNSWLLLDEAVKRWEANHFIAPRIRHIKQALEAHKRGEYAVSVPALCIHIEGIAADYVRNKKLLPKLSGKTREVVVAALNGTPTTLTDVRQYAAIESLLSYVQNDMYVFTDFDKEYSRLRRNRKLVAHAVRHGRQITYDTRMNSLKLLLVLDVLSLLR